MRLAILAAALACAAPACSSKRAAQPGADSDDAAVAPAAPDAGAPTAAAAEPLPRLATDPLWRLAGDSVKLGAVFADGSLEAIGAGAREVGRVLSARPRGKELWDRVTRPLRSRAGFELQDTTRWGEAGLDPGRGAALFVTADDRTAMVLPVGDLARFREVFGMARKRGAGRELDYSAKTGYCLAIAGRYACSQAPELLIELAAKQTGSLGRRALGLPETLRGSFELVADLSAFPGARTELAGLDEALTGIGLLAVGARFAGGRVSAEGWLAGQRSGRIGEAFRNLPAARPLAPHAAGATGVVAMRLPIRELIGPAEVPPAMPAGNLDLKPILFEQLTGQFALISAGRGLTGGTVVLGLADEKPLASALPQLCAMARPIAADPSFRGGRCRAAVRPEALGPALPGVPSALREPIAAEVTTVPGAALIRIADQSHAAGAPPPFVDGDWHVLGWGRSFDPLATAPAPLGRLISAILAKKLDPETLELVELVRWIANHVYELGARGRLDADGIRASLLVTSFAADPAPVYAAYQKAVAALVAGDAAGYRDQMKAIAAAHPDSLAARQAALVERNAPAVGLGTGVYAALGIPAFLRYLRRPRDGSGAATAEAPPTPPLPPGQPL